MPKGQKRKREEDNAEIQEFEFPVHGIDLARKILLPYFAKNQLLVFLCRDLIPIVFGYAGIAVLSNSPQKYHTLYNMLHNALWEQRLGEIQLPNFNWRSVAQSELTALITSFSTLAEKFANYYGKESRQLQRPYWEDRPLLPKILTKETLEIEPPVIFKFLKNFLERGLNLFFSLDVSNPTLKIARDKTLDILDWSIQILCVTYPEHVNELASFYSKFLNKDLTVENELDIFVLRSINAAALVDDKYNRNPKYIAKWKFSTDKDHNYPVLDWRLIAQPRFILNVTLPYFLTSKNGNLRVLWYHLANSPELFNDVFYLCSDFNNLAKLLDNIGDYKSDYENCFPENFFRRSSAQLMQVLAQIAFMVNKQTFFNYIVNKIVRIFEQDIYFRLENRNYSPKEIKNILEIVGHRPFEITQVAAHLGWSSKKIAEISVDFKYVQGSFNWTAAVVKEIKNAFKLKYYFIQNGNSTPAAKKRKLKVLDQAYQVVKKTLITRLEIETMHAPTQSSSSASLFSFPAAPVQQPLFSSSSAFGFLPHFPSSSPSFLPSMLPPNLLSSYSPALFGLPPAPIPGIQPHLQHLNGLNVNPFNGSGS